MTSPSVSPTSTAVGVLAGPGAWGYPADDDRLLVAEAGLGAASVAAIGSYAIDFYDLQAATSSKLGLGAATITMFVGWMAMGTARVASWFPAPTPLAACRTGVMTIVVATWTATDRNLDTLKLWPLGAVIGFEAYITTRTLGIDDAPLDLSRRLALSPVSLGALIGFVLLGGLGPGSLDWGDAWRICLGTVLAAAVGLIAFAAADLAERRAASEIEHHRKQGQLLELAARANWLHNEVIGTINPVRQQALGSSNPEVVETGELLDEIIQDWRATQLDLAIASRPVRLAEILSHVSRTYRRLGVGVAAPGAETGQLVLEMNEADLVYQTLSNTMSNAANAGATQIEICIEVHPDALSVVVTDNGRGFNSPELPSGRGIDRLNQVLHEPLEIVSRDGRTVVTAKIDRSNDG